MRFGDLSPWPIALYKAELLINCFITPIAEIAAVTAGDQTSKFFVKPPQ